MSTIPAKGSPEWELWRAAIEVAISAPERHGPTTSHALVYWPDIEALRTALDAVGIDWLSAKRKQVERGQESPVTVTITTGR